MMSVAYVTVARDTTYEFPSNDANDAHRMVAAVVAGTAEPGPDWKATELPPRILGARLFESPNEPDTEVAA